MKTAIRRYDLDWLRVIVFGLLIFYHVGMFFVPWGWHIKNNVIYEWLRWPMLFLNQWRLPILFVISGMGTYYALSRRTLKQFTWERIKRLWIPLAFGMLIIVPPQVYFERLANAQFTGSYLEFFPKEAFIGVYPEGNLSWHHLWFLPYLLIYSLVLAPIFHRLKNRPSGFKTKIIRLLQHPWALYAFIVPLYLIEAFMEPFFPVTHALIDDWFNFTFSMVLFFYGFVLLLAGNVFWERLEKLRTKALFLGLFTFTAMLVIWQFEDGYVVHFTEALLKVTNLWSWILVLLGYGAKYLNRPSRTIAYCNRAVYPFYILHQTITVGLGFMIKDWHWDLLPKFTILTLGTFLLSWLLYDLIILRIPFLHPFFGLKPKPKDAMVQQ